MSDITYTARQDSPESIRGFEQYQDADTNLISSYQVNNLFDVTKNFAQVHILDLADTLLESRYDYTRYTLSANAQSAGRTGASILTISPIQDALAYGYSYGGVKLLYHFLSDLYTEDNSTLEFYIDRISEDRKELSLLTQNITADEVDRYTQQIKARLTDQSDFSEFRLDFKDNNLFIGVNIDTLDTVNGKSVVVKLYEPLPTNYTTRSTLNILETISDSVAYELDYEVEQAEEPPLNLRPANFNIDISEQSIIPTQYLNYDELLSYRVNNANSEIYSILNEKGIEISIDYTDYSTFIHFSSAQERLLNFKYKVDLLAEYTQKMDLASTLTSGAQGISGSRSYYENLYQGIINNFDHYERFLYYESGSSCWPKSNTTKPYINIRSKDPITNVPDPIVASWYNEALTNSIAYDRSNYSILSETIPTYLRDDDSNVNYITFIYMLGQHFDNLWVYGKAVTDKYDADNRLDFGISKDLVGEALKNFGVKLYTSNKSIEDLFGTFIGQSYQSGSEYIATYVTGSLTGSNAAIQPSSFDDYQKDIQKRIYHNLPLLIKSKGTERGLRALINCFGIPSDILQIKLYGGRNINERPFFGDYQHYTSSLDKIRLDHTGSLIPGNTLSENTSTVKKSPKYTDDLHTIEVGFSPSDNIDNYILSNISASFNIDQYIGDPRNLTSANYDGLFAVAESILANLDRYNLQDYVRLIKFFDNVIFKMVKDFIPARAVADTGIIIKPNLLNRSKAKSVIVEATSPQETEKSAIIDTAFIEGSDGGIYDSGSIQLVTGHLRPVTTPEGISWRRDHEHEEAKYNGELYNSEIVVTDGELEKNNPYLNPIYPTSIYNVAVYPTSPLGLCTLAAGGQTQYAIVNTTVDLRTFFTNANANTQFSVGSSLSTLQQQTGQTFSFGNQPGQLYYIQATDPDSNITCQRDTIVEVQQCNVLPNNAVQTLVAPGEVITLASYFNNPNNAQVEYYINSTLQLGTTYTVPADAIAANNLQFTLTAKSYGGACTVSRPFNVSTSTIALVLHDKYVTTLDARMTITTIAGNPTITAKGIVWSSTNTNPTIGGAGCASLASTSTSTAPTIPIYPHPLTANTQYYLRAYATTAFGTFYSNQIETTTRELGSITIIPAYQSVQYRFQATITNPAFLPIKQVPILELAAGAGGAVVPTTQPRDGFTFEYRSPDPAFANTAPIVKYTQVAATAPGTYAGECITQKDYYQSNTNYIFKAKVQYIQGATPHILEVTSSVLNHLVPPLEIGDDFQGGSVFAVIQNTQTSTPNPAFFVNGVPTRKVSILHPTTKGQTPVYNTAVVASAYPIPDYDFTDWRLPTQQEQEIIHGCFLSLTNGEELRDLANKYYWNSNTNATGANYRGLKFTSETTPIASDSIDSGWSTMYVRSVRVATQTSI